ncbi:MAG: hypothetical protein WA104_01255 [Thermodesulfovibrionales bacterium]
MRDYLTEYRNFSFTVPEKFSFPLDVFDKWKDRQALYWTDGIDELKLLSSKGASALKNRGIEGGY